MKDIILCSNCFHDQGLRLDAEKLGAKDSSVCPNCSSITGSKLSSNLVNKLAYRFFVWGTFKRLKYGGAPIVQFNRSQSTCITISSLLEEDTRLIEKAIGVGFFYYGPNLWMIGEVEPLKRLQDPISRASIINKILTEYPTIFLREAHFFYRIRKAPKNPEDFAEYDSPPLIKPGAGRFDAPKFPVMYGSQDLQICIHECRVTAEDDLFVATISPSYSLKLLDLSVLLKEKTTPFESLDIAMYMLFLAGKHSYDIARDLAYAINSAGYDGIVYPSYFSILHTGSMPFETIYGLPKRHLKQFQEDEQAKTISNLALFGRPIEERKVHVRCINKLILNRVQYDVHFGPVGY